MKILEPVEAALASAKVVRRTWSSIQARFGQIQKSVSTERDMMKQALALYKERHNQPFTYVECYDVLFKCPKSENGLGRSVMRSQSSVSRNRSSSEGTGKKTTANYHRRVKL
ncbi:hypothetical protein F442_07501 [Phytophthora nicotianae P10297]|uniref:Uncharacterized protein n=1 Tax=Phytophthora nicotianae P10297 TaxID=1317064 RepID=W2ZGY4_PHYNI|nr:hypothetical protein F442_07501 [Phytophthora nicotianae P10297]